MTDGGIILTACAPFAAMFTVATVWHGVEQQHRRQAATRAHEAHQRLSVIDPTIDGDGLPLEDTDWDFAL